MDDAVATGAATTPAHPSRTALLEAVRADRAGPVASRLLQLARRGSPFVRHDALDLLHSTAAAVGRYWPEAVDTAVDRLADHDVRVRSRAARLLGHCGPPDLVLATLGETADPVVRTILARGLGPAATALAADPVAAVRFLAHLMSLRDAAPAEWPGLDAALFADVREAALHLDPADIGESWGWALYRLGRERHTYALVARLLGDPATRDIGARLARTACHHWRSAAVELLPLLVRHRGPGLTPAFQDAFTTASVSARAMCAHGTALKGLPFTPYPKSHHAVRTRPGAVHDRGSAASLLAAKPIGITRLDRAAEVFGALLDAGPLTFRQAAQLYNLTFRWPGRVQAQCAPLWLRHAGPVALPRLLAVMTPYLDDHGIGEYYLRGLARMGREALPALPSVTALIDRRTRIPCNGSTPDAETALDESLLAAALSARRAIAGTAAPDTPAAPAAPGRVRSVDAPTGDRRKALEEAVRQGHARMVSVLAEGGTDPEQLIGAYDETTPLCLAAALGHTAVAEALLDAGARPGARNRSGHLPLVLAATSGPEGRTETVDLLLERGADIDAVMRGRTALEWAARFGRTHMVRHLLGLGATPRPTAPVQPSPDGP
ncbi:ankyrin repeat domain-containing protein [Streptomyces phyllanthi]|uniref:ankyrin repeat domain-containing protein n=1 Tax=Streptomyces phyllanthi TaxID=1803180 RepID=UPI0033878B7D